MPVSQGFRPIVISPPGAKSLAISPPRGRIPRDSPTGGQIPRDLTLPARPPLGPPPQLHSSENIQCI